MIARILVTMAALALVAGCVHPTVTYHQAFDPDVRGLTPMTLQVARVTFAPPGTRAAAAAPAPAAGAPAPAAAAPAAAPAAAAPAASANATTLATTWHDNPEPNATFFIEPHDGLFSLTQLSPTYRQDSTGFASLGVQTIDRRVELAQDVAGIISAFGDATVIGDGALRDQTITCSSIEPEWFAGQLAGHPERFGVLARARGASDQDCIIEVSFAPLPDGAVSLSAIDMDEQSSYLLVEACRRVTIDYLYYGSLTQEAPNITRLVAYVPDPYHARRVPLPYSGQLARTHVCSPPTVTLGQDKPAAPFSVFRNILAPFRNAN